MYDYFSWTFNYRYLVNQIEFCVITLLVFPIILFEGKLKIHTVKMLKRQWTR